MNVTRRTLLGTAAACLAAGSSFRAFAQGDWPSRLVRLVSPYAPGGASDISLRILAEQLGRRLSQQFIVENKPGAGTRLANEFAARAAPDGHTFLYAAAPYATAEALFGKLNYDRKDLQPVAMAVIAPIFLIVNTQSAFKNVQDLIAYGKSRPDGLTFGFPGRRLSTSPGSRAAVPGRRSQRPQRSLPRRRSGLHRIAGRPHRRDAHCDHHGLAAHRERQVARAGRGVRHTQPHLPAGSHLAGAGLAQGVASGWYGFMAPAATPRAIVDRMESEIIRALADGEIKQKLLAQGLEARGGTAAEFGKFVDDETRKWSELIREAGLKGE